MIIRIRLGQGKRIGAKRKPHRFALGMAGVLTPAAVFSAVVGLWRIAAGMNWTGSFAIADGFFSHWQVWLGGGVLLQLCAHLLNRHAKRLETAASSQPDCYSNL